MIGQFQTLLQCQLRSGQISNHGNILISSNIFDVPFCCKLLGLAPFHTHMKCLQADSGDIFIVVQLLDELESHVVFDLIAPVHVLVFHQEKNNRS